MFDTYVTIVGNVLTMPEWRRTTQSGTLVTNFKVASTARRLDRDSGRWVDGNSLRVRVNCWRKLAEGVAASVMVGDPVVVVGRLYTRDWTDDAGNHRTLYEMEAAAVGHDLSRGRGRFMRNRATATTSAVEDAEADSRVRGEVAEPVPTDQIPVRRDERLFDDESDLSGPGMLPVHPVSPAPMAPVDSSYPYAYGESRSRAYGDEDPGFDGTDLPEPLRTDDSTDQPVLDTEPDRASQLVPDRASQLVPDDGPAAMADDATGGDAASEVVSEAASEAAYEAGTTGRGRRGRGRIAVPV